MMSGLTAGAVSRAVRQREGGYKGVGERTTGHWHAQHSCCIHLLLPIIIRNFNSSIVSSTIPSISRSSSIVSSTFPVLV
jgi:hypothetical protein